MKYTWKRWGALLLALVMALSLFPATALAARMDDTERPAVPAEEVGAQAAAPAVMEDGPAALVDGDTSDDITATDDSRDIDRTTYTLTVSSENSTTHTTEGPKGYAADNQMNTFWHSNMATNESGRWIAVELPEVTWVSALRYRPRSDYTSANASATPTVNGNGYVTSYRIEVSRNGTDWTSVATGDWAAFENVEGRGMLPTGAWEVANFTPVQAKYIKLVGVHTAGNGNTDQYMHAAEIRVVAAPEEQSYTVSGTVVDAGNNNAPISGAVVNIEGATATTDENGAYSVTLRNGTYPVNVAWDGYEVTGGGTVTVSGGNVTGHTITMQRVARAITGTVTDGADPLEGATVTLVRAAAPYSTVSGVTAATTNAAGGYTLNVGNVPAGTYKVRAAKAGYGAALGDTEVTVTTDSPTATFTGGLVALTAIGGADYHYDMTALSPTYATGANTAARVENGGLLMNFSGTDAGTSQVKLNDITAADLVVEFDATRGGTNAAAGFGVALRFADNNNFFYVGQSHNAGGWFTESVSGGTHQTSEAVQGPSFLSGDTRHFEIVLHQADGVAKASLWIDGVQVLNDVQAGGSEGNGPTAAGQIAFMNWGNNTTVTVKDLYITSADSKLTITMPDTLTAYALGSDTPLPPGTEPNTVLASEGDVVNIYSADPAEKQMAAPLTVKKTADDTVVSTENILHVTHNGSAHKERGYYVQFQMPAYDVTLTSTLKSYLEGVTLTKDEDSGTLTTTVAPQGATAAYQWFREGTTENTWTLIEGATGSTYTPQSADAGYHLKVEASGTGNYSGVVSATTQQTVTNAITGVSILRSTAADEVVDVGGSAVLRATITPAQGVDLAVTWTAEPQGVVNIEALPNARKDPNMDAAYSEATITGVAAGTATVTIRTSNGLTDARTVTVGKAVANVIFEENDEFTLYTNPVTAEQSNTKTLTPTVNPSDATNPALTWWSTDETVATVTQGGVVTAVAPGTAEIYVRSQQKPSLRAYRSVKVVTLPTALELDVTEAELVLRPGSASGAQVVVPTLTPTDASDKTVVWTTGSSAVATVTKPWAADTGSQNALITAQGVGETDITATSAANGALVKKVHVTVKQEIVGQAAVSGELKFGSELTADVNDIIEAAKNDLTYAWYRGETAQGTALATTKTYTPVKEDIGQKLTVKVTAAGDYYFGETTYTTGTVTKADGLPLKAVPTFTNVSAAGEADGEITGLFKGRKYEYKQVENGTVDPGETGWTAFSDMSDDETGLAGNFGTAKITGLEAGTYVVRRAADDCYQAGPHRTVTISIENTGDVVVHNPQTFVGGLVTVGRTQIPEGDTVRLRVTPDTGYELVPGSLKATPNAGDEVIAEADEETEGLYTFIMPRGIASVTISAEFRLKTYTIGHALTNINCNMAGHDHTTTHGTPFTIILTPAEGYEMPRSLTVTVTETGQRFTDYTYTAADPDHPETRTLTFAHGVTQNVSVHGDGVLKTFPVEYVRERVSFLSAPARAGWHQEFIAAVTPDAGYQLPDEITVTMGGQAFTDFTYTKETGAIHIAADLVEDALAITVQGEREIVPLEKVSISGVAKVGQRLTANITPAGADGHVTYQWCWATLNSDGTVASVQEITGATGRSRAITELSQGKQIVMKVTAVSGGGFSGMVLSQPTGVVVAADADGVMPANVEIVRPSVSIDVGATDTLVAYVTPSNATNKTVLWETSDPAVVSVANGVITGVAPGTATITVTTAADETIRDTCVVTVTASSAVQAEAEDVVTAYDGLAHGIQVAVTDPVDGSARVTYSSDGVNFSANNPTFSAVGEYVVWYQVTATGMVGAQGQAKVTIEKATPKIAITASPSALSGAGEVTLTVTLPAYADRTGSYVEASDLMLPVIRNEDGTYTVELPGDHKTYTFTATLLGTDQYAEVSATCTVRVGASTSGGNSTSSETTQTETREDGTKVTTVTKPDGTVTKTAEKPDGSKSETVTTKDGAVTITVTDAKGEELAKVELPATIPAPETRFDDVPEGHWADKAIHNAAALELVKGVGNNKFDMVAPMSRGSLATVLHRLSQGKTDYETTFQDVAEGKFYTEGVAWAAKAGVVTGYTADIFAPEDVITREQLAVMLARYAKLIGMDTSADPKALEAFADGENTGSWAVNGVAWCVNKGILQGKGGNVLDPTTNVTRAEVAVMLDRFIALLK